MVVPGHPALNLPRTEIQCRCPTQETGERERRKSTVCPTLLVAVAHARLPAFSAVGNHIFLSEPHLFSQLSPRIGLFERARRQCHAQIREKAESEQIDRAAQQVYKCSIGLARGYI